ncbi:MAG: hypothetical protein RMK00_09500 [Bacteroidota bacterium]|nr:hypothetical protein [Candidatus Kapabacteria bacterium]MDW8075987.1 hypothetical protein [Bacteroidota bacterium]
MKHAVIVAMSVLVGLLLTGCKSETTAPEIPAELFPLKPGNYWVYAIYSVDTNGLRQQIRRYDSVVVGEMSRVAGRQAYHLYFFRSEDPNSDSYTLYDSAYAAIDANNNLWMYGLFGKYLFWWKLLGSTPSWVVVDTTYPDARIKITGTRAGTEPYSVDGNTFTSQKFTHMWDLIMSGDRIGGPMTLWFVPKIGLVRRHYLFTLFSARYGVVVRTGEDHVMLRYRVQ